MNISWNARPVNIIGSLSKGDFERHSSTGSGLFAFLSSGFAWTFRQIVSKRVKTLNNPNLLASKYIQRAEVVTSRCHRSKISRWQQIKTSLKRWIKIRDVSNFIDLIQFHSICQMLEKCSGLNPKGPYLSLEKERKFLCCAHLLDKAGEWN